MSLYVVNVLSEKGFSTLLRSVNCCLISADFFYVNFFFRVKFLRTLSPESVPLGS